MSGRIVDRGGGIATADVVSWVAYKRLGDFLLIKELTMAGGRSHD